MTQRRTATGLAKLRRLSERIGDQRARYLSERDAMVRQAYKDGISQDAIATELGISRQMVGKILAGTTDNPPNERTTTP